jgi:hypothetical protein
MLIVYWSPSNANWWSWQRYLWAMHERYGRRH